MPSSAALLLACPRALHCVALVATCRFTRRHRRFFADGEADWSFSLRCSTATDESFSGFPIPRRSLPGTQCSTSFARLSPTILTTTVASASVPGEQGELGVGARRLNWVWYWNTDSEHELPDILRDREGRSHRASVPAGAVQPRHIAALHERADKHLPAVLAQLVRSTPEPFVQVIYDLRAPAMCVGAVAILGDSACIVRPHTAAGTSKASGDAVSLAQHLQAADFDLSVALPRWQTERLALAERLIHHGWRLARNSGLGQCA